MPEKQLTFLNIQEQMLLAKNALDKAETIQGDLLQEYFENNQITDVYLSYSRPHYSKYGKITLDYIQQAINILTYASDLIEQDYREKRKGFIQ